MACEVSINSEGLTVPLSLTTYKPALNKVLQQITGERSALLDVVLDTP